MADALRRGSVLTAPAIRSGAGAPASGPARPRPVLRLVRPLFAAGLALAAGCASPANLQTETGKAYYDRGARVLTLRGTDYDVPAAIPTTLLKTGDEVRIRWEPQGDRRVVTRLRITEFQVFGRR